MKLVINKCYGGFGLSYAGMMAYAKLAGIKLYAYVNKRDSAGNMDFNVLEEYDGKSKAFFVRYATAPLQPDGQLPDGAYFSDGEIDRADPHLIAAVKKLGNSANAQHAKLKIVTIPNGVDWQIEEYDGQESVAEKHRTWG